MEEVDHENEFAYGDGSGRGSPATLAFAGTALAQQPRTLKMQSAVPPSSTTQDAFKFFAERVDKLTGGNLKIEALPGGAVVPPFEILDAAHKKVIDGA